MKTKLICLLIALSSATAMWAEKFKYGGVYYETTSDSTVSVTYRNRILSDTSKNYTITTVTIPSSIKRNRKTYKVTRIGRYAFEGCQRLKSITIPYTVTHIDAYAFRGCTSLATITNSPSSLISVPGGVFDDTPWFKNQLDGAVYIGNVLYKYKGEMPENTNFIIKEETTTICEGAFFNCTGLTSITIPKNIISIGWSSFEGCTNLTSVIWNTDKYLDSYCPFRSQLNIKSFVFGDKIEHIPAYVCEYMSKLTSITIPKNVRSIGEYAFYRCDSLTSVVWNAKQCAPLEKWGGQEYEDRGNYYYGPFGSIASQITSFTFGDEVESIPRFLCYKMENLTSVTIPKSVTYFGDDAFYNCVGLTSITWNVKKCTTERFAPIFYINYRHNPELRSHVQFFTFGNEVEKIPPYLCDGMSNISTIALPESLTNIGDGAFGGCQGLTSVIIPEKVDSIGAEAFRYCTGLTSIRIPQNVRYIGEEAFSGTSISSIEYDAKSAKFGHPRVGEGTFYDICGQIESFVIGNDVDSLPMNLCLGMNKLTSVTIPKNVKYMDYYIFGSLQSNYCTGLTHITMESPIPPEIADGCFGFWGIEHRFFIYVPCGSQDAYREAEHWENEADWIFEPAATYTLSVQSANEEQGYTTILQPNTCSSDEAIIAADPNIGYNFVQWSDGNTDNPRTVVVTQDTTFTAEFVVGQYTITTTDSEHGTISGAGTYTYGTEITLTATASEHYHFTQWNDGNTDNPRTVSIEGDATYMAEFAIDQHTITTNAQNGTITGGGTYDYGTTATLTANVDEHYHFTRWTDGNTENPRKIMVEGDATYTAEFAIDQHSITVTCNPQQGVVTGAGIYDYGTQVTLTATANDSYEFTHWSNGVTDNPYILTATEDLTLEAQFISTTAVEDIRANDATAPRKVFRNGQVYILRDGKTYTTTGVEVK